jgi:hypothetical protein
MRSTKIVGVGLAALAASCSLCAAASGVAKPRLVIREYEGGPVMSPGLILVHFEESSPSEHFCQYIEPATLVHNSRPTDTISAKFALNCEEIYKEQYFWTGKIKSVKLTGGGTLTVTAKIEVTVPSPTGGVCHYDVKKLTGSFMIPGDLNFVNVSATGALNTKTSAASCSQRQVVVAVTSLLVENHPVYVEN